MQSKMGEQMADYFAEMLFTFIKTFYQTQWNDFKGKLVNIFQKG